MVDILSLRHLAAHLLAEALLELFPSTSLLNVKGTQSFFYCDIEPVDLNPEILVLLKERIRGLAKGDTPLKFHESLGSNAAGWLKERKQPHLAQGIAKDQIISLIEIDHHLAPCPMLSIKSSRDLEYVDLYEILRIKRNGKERLRIIGNCESDKNQLKIKRKSYLSLKNLDHEDLYQEMELYNEVTLPRGERLNFLIQNRMRFSMESSGFKFIANVDEKKRNPFLRASNIENLFAQIEGMKIVGFSLCNKQDQKREIERYSKAIEKIFSDLELEISRDQKQWRCVDLYGELQIVAELEISSCGWGPYKIFKLSIAPINKIMNLLLEKDRGLLPFGVNPEQLRILVVDKRASDYAKMLFCRVHDEGLQLYEPTQCDQLNQEVVTAVRQRVAYCAILGEREAKDGLVTLREIGTMKEELIEFKQVADTIKKNYRIGEKFES